MPEGQKDPMTKENFSVDDYKDKLIEQEYSEATATMLAEKKKEELNKMESMDSNTKEMLIWHRDQIMKLLGENDLSKILIVDEL